MKAQPEPDIPGELTGLLRGVLGEAVPDLTEETRRMDVPGWDSFTHVSFLLAVESTYGIRFALADAGAFESVGEIVGEVRRLAGRKRADRT